MILLLHQKGCTQFVTMRSKPVNLYLKGEGLFLCLPLVHILRSLSKSKFHLN